MTAPVPRAPLWCALPLLLLTGCGSDGSPAEHALGEAVEVPHYVEVEDAEPADTYRISVDAVRATDHETLGDAGLVLDEPARATDAYLVDYTLDNSGSTPITFPRDPSGRATDGTLVIAPVIEGATRFVPCRDAPDEVPAGGHATGCTVLLVPEGLELKRIEFWPGGDTDNVVWSVGSLTSEE